jgi:hypothetical protein
MAQQQQEQPYKQQVYDMMIEVLSNETQEYKIRAFEVIAEKSAEATLPQSPPGPSIEEFSSQLHGKLEEGLRMRFMGMRVRCSSAQVHCRACSSAWVRWESYLKLSNMVHVGMNQTRSGYSPTTPASATRTDAPCSTAHFGPDTTPTDCARCSTGTLAAAFQIRCNIF